LLEKNIENVIMFQIERTLKIAKQYSQREFDALGLGITIEQWILLKIIEEEKELSQKELAQKSTRDPASITRTLDLLQKKNFVIREALPNNRRQYNIILTKEGAAFVQKNMDVVHQQRLKSVEGLSNADLQSLKQMLQKIQNNLSD